MKLNKKHGGKEFKSFFQFAGQIKQHVSGTSDNPKFHPIYDETITRTNKPRRVLQFDVLTNKYNKLHVQLAGMEKEFAYIISSSDKKSQPIKWADRNNKDKYPNKTYHVIATEWDLSEEISQQIKEEDWVLVKGKYEFDKFVNDEGKEIPTVKRIISSVELIEDGQEIKLRGKNTVNYVCDFDSPDFVEVNSFDLEIGIKSVYQDENTNEVTVNAVFLDYGKEKSTPKDVKLTVYPKEVEDGKKSLADAFTNLNRLDFIQVIGVDNNRPIFTEVEEIEEDDDIFADVDDKVVSTKKAISGNKKGLEITAVVSKTHQKEMLTEDEIELSVEEDLFGSDTIDESDLPF